MALSLNNNKIGTLYTKCGYTLENICGLGCPCKIHPINTHLNIIWKNPKKDSLMEGIEPPNHLPEVKYINVRGREEHEAVIKDSELCKELGLDQIYEIMVYLKRWGSWLGEK